MPAKLKFSDQVYQLLKQVPQGKVTTYKALAQALKCKAYQAVGQAMRNNPYAPQVPCHRVVSSTGLIGGFKGERDGQTIQEKIALLTQEGIKIKNNQVQNFSEVLYQF
jgi:methylated-DNA-[protein]-cysteine S-methyltransferase